MGKGNLKQTDLFTIAVQRLSTLNLIFECGLDSFRLVKYFVNPDTEVEKRVIKRPSISFLTYVLWRDTIVSFSKIFPDSRNDKYNIQKYIQFILSHEQLKVKTEPETLERYLAIFQSNKIIDQIKADRDHYYAHTDEEVRIYYSPDYMSKLTLLCKDLSQVIKILYRDIPGGMYVGHVMEAEDHEKQLLRDLAEYDRLKAKEIMKRDFYK